MGKLDARREMVKLQKGNGNGFGVSLNELAQKGLLPTPMASDATTGAIIGKNDQFITTMNGTPRKINQNGQNGSVGLARMVQILPTPNAREADKYSKKYNPDSQMGTALTALAVNGMLPTPTNSMVTYQDFVQAGYHSSKRPEYGLIPTPVSNDAKNSAPYPSQQNRDSVIGYLMRQGVTGKTSRLNPPVCRGNDGLPFDVERLTISLTAWCTGSIKGYGNAIVPQVMYEIFKAIETIQDNIK